MTLYNKELQHISLKFQSLLVKNISDITFLDETYRDYLVMFTIKVKGIKAGKVSIYYKPTKKTYSLKLNMQNAEVENMANNLWDKLNGCQNHSAESGIYEIYVDGSYINGITGYGAVIFFGDEKIKELSGTAKTTQFRQFTGELKAAIVALKWCKENNIDNVRVNYDYAGVEKFATGAWKAGNEVSKYYVNFMQKISLNIQWRHIKSHTGNKKNDLADKLAKDACKTI